MEANTTKLIYDMVTENLEHIVRLGEKGAEALKILLDVNKLKQDNGKLNKEINELYLQIGQEVYKKNGGSSSIVKEKITKINHLNSQIEENLEKIKDIEQKAKKDGVSVQDLKVVKDVYDQISEHNENNKASNKKSKKAVQKISTKQSSKKENKK